MIGLVQNLCLGKILTKLKPLKNYSAVILILLRQLTDDGER